MKDKPHKPFCNALDEWAKLMDKANDGRGFGQSWRVVRTAIGKSCLLDRVIHRGEKPSQTPCPVHKGIWSGIQFGWPGSKWSDGTPMKESPHLRAWVDAGCRCSMHRCGCTTGWQPDEHCGCVPAQLEQKPEVL